MTLKQRMAYFSNIACEYIKKHNTELDIAVFHEWHGAYAINRLRNRYIKKWIEGQIPALVFVVHNNNPGYQGIYDNSSENILPLYEDNRNKINVMVDALEADKVILTPFSLSINAQKSFGGYGINRRMKQKALQGDLFGINDFSEMNAQLYEKVFFSAIKKAKNRSFLDQY